MSRKTIEVGTLLYRLNYFLANKNTTAEEREVMCQFVEGVLHETGNYEGYRYLDTDEIAGNGSRRYYFVSDALQDAYQVHDELTKGI